jgi:phosphoglycerate dehydrogenase-like enzyme
MEHPEPRQALAHDFGSAEALISVRFNRSFPFMPALKLLQAASTGINSILLDTVPAGVPVCNAYGHQIAVAEYAILGMLVCARDLLRTHRRFARGKWHESETGVIPTYGEVYGKTVCIIGLGRIGLETAGRAKALRMRVIGCNRTTDRKMPNVDELSDLSGIVACVARADFVVVACALTEETRGIVDSRVLGAMKRTAFIVNVGRGPLIDESHLYEALLTGQIGGAVLDVWYRYPNQENPHPPPSKFPFHELDNVIITPHVSGWTDGMLERRWSEIATNLDNLALGKALINLSGVGCAKAVPQP